MILRLIEDTPTLTKLDTRITALLSNHFKTNKEEFKCM